MKKLVVRKTYQNSTFKNISKPKKTYCQICQALKKGEEVADRQVENFNKKEEKAV